MACLDLKLIDWAQVFLKAICSMFPDGIKTMRLLGMFYEAQGKTLRAQEIYQELLESCPHDTQTVKRLISLFKYNDMIGDAVIILNKYLEVNQIDEEAWLELADLHLSRQNFSRAQYCLEELLTVNPTSYTAQLRLAEVVYSGAVANNNNTEQFMLARKYYSMALVLIDDVNADLTKTNVNTSVPRALFGLLKCCKAIKQFAKKVDEKNA